MKSIAFIALACALVSVAGETRAEELLTPSFEDRRDKATGPQLIQMRSTVETLIKAYKEGKITVLGNKGRTFSPDRVPVGPRRRIESRFRRFARATMPVKRVPTRSVVMELMSEPKLAEIAPFEFDDETGDVVVHIKEELWTADIHFNVYQLGAASRYTARYLLSRPERLEP